MADSGAPSTGESTSQMLQAYIENLPKLMQVTNSQAAPAAQAQLDAANTLAPGIQDLTTKLYQQFAPQLAQTSRDITTADRTQQGKDDVNILNTSGRDLAKTYDEIDRSLNPEYYATREVGADKLGQLLNSINLNDPNPEAERLVNQANASSGNLGNTSATSTVANALSFGDEANKRRAALSQAINTASGFLQPAKNTSFDAATASLNRPTSNAGVTQFAGVNQNAGVSAANAGNNLLNNINSTQNNAMQINANRRDELDRVTGVIDSL